MPFIKNSDQSGLYKFLYLSPASQAEQIDADTENRFSLDWCAEMEEVLTNLEKSIAAGEKFGVIITSGGKFFSNGLDIVPALADPKSFPAYIDRVDEIYARILLLGAPTAAAINGHAFGAGAMLALCTDFSVMRTERGFFSLPEAVMGMHFPQPMVSLLQHSLTSQTLRKAVLTSHRFDSEQALSGGIITSQADIADLIPKAQSLIEAYIPMSGLNYGLIKSELHHDLVTQLRTELDRDFSLANLIGT